MKKIIYISLFINVLFLIAIWYKSNVKTHPATQKMLDTVTAAENGLNSRLIRKTHQISSDLDELWDLKKMFEEGMEAIRFDQGVWGDLAVGEGSLLPYADEMELGLKIKDYQNDRNIVYDRLIKQGRLSPFLYGISLKNERMENNFLQAAKRINEHPATKGVNLDSLYFSAKTALPAFDSISIKKSIKNATYAEADLIIKKLFLDIAIREWVWLDALGEIAKAPRLLDTHYTTFILPKSSIVKLGDDFIAEAAVCGYITDLSAGSGITIGGKTYHFGKNGTIPLKDYPKQLGLREIRMDLSGSIPSTGEQLRGSSTWACQVIE